MYASMNIKDTVNNTICAPSYQCKNAVSIVVQSCKINDLYIPRAVTTKNIMSSSNL